MRGLAGEMPRIEHRLSLIAYRLLLGQPLCSRHPPTIIAKPPMTSTPPIQGESSRRCALFTPTEMLPVFKDCRGGCGTETKNAARPSRTMTNPIQNRCFMSG